MTPTPGNSLGIRGVAQVTPQARGADPSQDATGLMGGDGLLRPSRRVIHRGAAFPVPHRGHMRKEESGERKVGDGGSYFIRPDD